ncbi:MAG: cytochrome c biogenesis protein CcdA [Clostridiales bacterium]|nr:cytochrome c biogenesis protein CcdA [Clostridiales bacterium]
MEYLVSFLEGIITFVSPCLLPMLPVYVSYFAGGFDEHKKAHALKNALGFVLGFTVTFMLMGALSGTVGSFLIKYQTIVNIITGAIVIVFGLNFCGVINIAFLNMSSGARFNKKDPGFVSSLIFGAVFSISWTPCVGAFLGSALMLASQSASALKGVLMLLTYSLGLGIPFIISAVLIDKLKAAFDFIKRNYKTINLICGIFLIIVGLLMMTGLMGRFMTLLS